MTQPVERQSGWKPGFQQPRTFRPLLRDDTLDHQIRIGSTNGHGLYVSCLCAARPRTEPLGMKDRAADVTAYRTWRVITDSDQALAWYSEHLRQVDQVDDLLDSLLDQVEDVDDLLDRLPVWMRG